ncbi:hypothetical protein [Nostoc sp.]
MTIKKRNEKDLTFIFARLTATRKSPNQRRWVCDRGNIGVAE